MVLQRLFGLSDREAVEAFTFDTRWKYACGGLVFDHAGFAHTVLVDMRARLDASDDKRRIFNVTVEAAGAAGLVGAKRVLDSTPLYDAVATMDTITLIRSAIRGLLRVADDELEGVLRGVMRSGDDYASAAKPQIDWDDVEARDALIDSRARDAFAGLAVLDGRELGAEVAEADELLATVVGQDLEETDDGSLRIARRVAKDRVISTEDPEARHGHKTQARGFDGYKGHVAVDPDSEVITDTVVSAGNAGADIDSRCKTQPPAPRPGGLFTKDRFAIDLDADTVTCPNDVTVTIRVGVYEQRLADARAQHQDPDWVDDYRATRPTVARKLGHVMRRRHGGRRARVRGKRKVDADFNLLAAAHNLARLAVLGLRFNTASGWIAATWRHHLGGTPCGRRSPQS